MKELWVPISGAIAQQKNVETIANNVANANTPGFKKDQLVFKEYLSNYEKGGDIHLPNKEWKPKDFYHTHGAEKAFVKIDGSYTKHNQGQLNPTKSPLDMALNGSGFFEILTPNGIRYSRRGTFSINGDGKLVTNEGYPVLAKVDLPKAVDGQGLIDAMKSIPKPQERTINVGNGKFFVNQEGEVYISGEKQSNLSIVEFKNIQKLTKESTSTFVNADAQNIKSTPIKTTLHQGFIEQSNVNPIQEMSALIKAHRQFESIQRVIKAYDNMAGKAANEIARF